VMSVGRGLEELTWHPVSCPCLTTLASSRCTKSENGLKSGQVILVRLRKHIDIVTAAEDLSTP